MIQRLQSIYLLIATILSATPPLFLLMSKASETIHDSNLLEKQNLIGGLVSVLFLASTLITCITIFLFKYRKKQILLCQISILINLFLLGLLIYLSLNLSGEASVSEKGIGMFLPVLAILFIVLANKAIKKDEDLVKSVDRLK